MLHIERKDSRTILEVSGTSSEIAKELMELIVILSLRLDDAIDIKGLVQDEILWSHLTEQIRRRDVSRKEQSDDERSSASAES